MRWICLRVVVSLYPVVRGEGYAPLRFVVAEMQPLVGLLFFSPML
jgi:hypothetical protein